MLDAIDIQPANVELSLPIFATQKKLLSYDCVLWQLDYSLTHPPEESTPFDVCPEWSNSSSLVKSSLSSGQRLARLSKTKSLWDWSAKSLQNIWNFALMLSPEQITPDLALPKGRKRYWSCVKMGPNPSSTRMGFEWVSVDVNFLLHDFDSPCAALKSPTLTHPTTLRSRKSPTVLTPLASNNTFLCVYCVMTCSETLVTFDFCGSLNFYSNMTECEWWASRRRLCGQSS